MYRSSAFCFNSGTINYYQCYNIDLEIPQYYSIESYYNNKKDTIDKEQLLNILFTPM